MSLFKIPRPAWMLKEQAVLNLATEARAQLDRATTDDDRREARRRLERFEFTADRLKAARLHNQKLAAALMVYRA